MTTQAIGLRRIETYLYDCLPHRLKQDLCALRMVKESDLEACAYHYLRRFLRRDRSWSVYTRKYSIHTSHYIDLLLFRDGYPRIAIELKWNCAAMSRKDRRSLRRALRLLRVNRAYFMTTSIGARAYERIHKNMIEKNRLFEIIIPLPLKGKPLKDWKEKRRVFMSRMERGRARRKGTVSQDAQHRRSPVNG